MKYFNLIIIVFELYKKNFILRVKRIFEYELILECDFVFVDMLVFGVELDGVCDKEFKFYIFKLFFVFLSIYIYRYMFEMVEIVIVVDDWGSFVLDL